MKVLFITDAYPYKKKLYGGLPWYIVQELSKKTEGGIVLSKEKFRYNFFRTIYKSLREFKRLNPDIIQAFTLDTCGLVGLFLKFLTGKKLCIHARGADLLIFPNKNFITKVITNQILKNVDYLFVIGKLMGDAAISFGIDKNKLHVFEPGVILDEFKKEKSKNELRKELRLPLNKKIIIYVGFLYPRKGQIDLLNAVKDLKEDFLLLLVGDDWGSKKLCEKKIKEFGLSKKVRIVNNRTHEEIIKYLQASDIFASSSLFESSPCVLFEAMASGLPIAYTNVGSVASILKKENGILVRKRNPLDMQFALQKLLSNKKLREKMSKNNLKKIKNYDREKIPKQYLKVYKKLLKK